MAQLYLLCGRIGSGKTTYAQNLKDKKGAICLSPDAWMLPLFGEHLNPNDHAAKLEQVKKIIYSLSEQLLKQGIPVILDFGFWTKQERTAIRARFNRHDVELIYIKTDEKTILERLEKRNQSKDGNAYTVDEALFFELNQKFEEPGADESSTIYCETPR